MKQLIKEANLKNTFFDESKYDLNVIDGSHYQYDGGTCFVQEFNLLNKEDLFKYGKRIRRIIEIREIGKNF